MRVGQSCFLALVTALIPAATTKDECNTEDSKSTIVNSLYLFIREHLFTTARGAVELPFPQLFEVSARMWHIGENIVSSFTWVIYGGNWCHIAGTHYVLP